MSRQRSFPRLPPQADSGFCQAGPSTLWDGPATCAQAIVFSARSQGGLHLCFLGVQHRFQPQPEASTGAQCGKS